MERRQPHHSVRQSDDGRTHFFSPRLRLLATSLIAFVMSSCTTCEQEIETMFSVDTQRNWTRVWEGGHVAPG